MTKWWHDEDMMTKWWHDEDMMMRWWWWDKMMTWWHDDKMTRCQKCPIAPICTCCGWYRNYGQNSLIKLPDFQNGSKMGVLLQRLWEWAKMTKMMMRWQNDDDEMMMRWCDDKMMMRWWWDKMMMMMRMSKCPIAPFCVCCGWYRFYGQKSWTNLL